MCGSGGVRKHLTMIFLFFFYKGVDINAPDAVRWAWHAMRRARLTGGWAVLCADRMDGELEDPGRHDEEQREGRTRLH